MDLKKCLFLITALVSLYLMYSCEQEHVVIKEKADDVLIVDTIYRGSTYFSTVNTIDTSYRWQSSRTTEAVADANLVELYTQDSRFSSRGRSELLSTFAWTNNADREPSYDGRALIKFNELDLLGDVQVDSAFMTLFIFTEIPYTAFVGPYGDNRLAIHAVVEDWEETKVNWVNQPNVESTFEITTEITISDDSLMVPVTSQVSKMLVKGNLGFLLKTWQEDMPSLASLRFYSSDAEGESKRPYLTVYYHEK